MRSFTRGMWLSTWNRGDVGVVRKGFVSAVGRDALSWQGFGSAVLSVSFYWVCVSGACGSAALHENARGAGVACGCGA